MNQELYSALGRRTILVISTASLMFLAGCQPQDQATSKPEVEELKVESIVVMGDSVASGEGINYGYTYYFNDFSNLISHWRGGTEEPTWQEPYPLCHDSEQAYGNLVAKQLGVNLAKFACTGATYENGVIAERSDKDEIFRPAEFGNWATQENLNPQYDTAAPDVVVITLGADDVSFVDVVTFCSTGYSARESRKVESLVDGDNAKDNIKEDFVSRHAKRSVLEGDKTNRVTRSASSYCTADNPGQPIQTLFWDPIQNGTITANYQSLVHAIQERGQQAGKVPHIIFTTYHNPLPRPEQAIDCFDLGDLDRDEINYLNTLQDTLNDTIKSAVGDMPGVSIADISNVMDEHKWCSPEPWAYGMTVLISDPSSKAPFHPTPEGQQAIAEIVKAAIAESSSSAERAEIAEAIRASKEAANQPVPAEASEPLETEGQTQGEGGAEDQEASEAAQATVLLDPSDEVSETIDGAVGEVIDEVDSSIKAVEKADVIEAVDEATDTTLDQDIEQSATNSADAAEVLDATEAATEEN